MADASSSSPAGLKKRRISIVKQDKLLDNVHHNAFLEEQARKMKQLADGVREFPHLIDTFLSFIEQQKQKNQIVPFPRGVTTYAGEHSGVPKQTVIKAINHICPHTVAMDLKSWTIAELRPIFVMAVGALAKSSLPEKHMTPGQFLSVYSGLYEKHGRVLRLWQSPQKPSWCTAIGFYRLCDEHGRSDVEEFTHVLHGPSGCIQQIRGQMKIQSCDVPSKWTINQNHVERAATLDEDDGYGLKLSTLFKTVAFGKWGVQAGEASTAWSGSWPAWGDAAGGAASKEEEGAAGAAGSGESHLLVAASTAVEEGPEEEEGQQSPPPGDGDEEELPPAPP